MGFQTDPGQLPGLFNNDPGGSIGYRKNTGTYFDAGMIDLFLESVRNSLWQESNLRLFFTLGVPDNSLPVFDIYWYEFLAPPILMPLRAMGSSSNRFLGSWGRENNFIDHILFKNIRLGRFASSEQFS
jgi:hypothetical protein